MYQELEKEMDLDLKEGKQVEVWCGETKLDWYNNQSHCGHWSKGEVLKVFKDLVTVSLVDAYGWPEGRYVTVPATSAYVRSLDVSQ